jgi:hypothetical protein
VSEQFLYFFPAHAGNVLLDQAWKIPGRHKQAEWLSIVLNRSAVELAESIARPGDPEDKMILLDVFLWKQRHGLIDRGLRVESQFSRWPDGYYLQRYMVANGYEGVLSTPQYLDQPRALLEEVDWLLDRFKSGDSSQEDLWGSSNAP